VGEPIAVPPHGVALHRSKGVLRTVSTDPLLAEDQTRGKGYNTPDIHMDEGGDRGFEVNVIPGTPMVGDVGMVGDTGWGKRWSDRSSAQLLGPSGSMRGSGRLDGWWDRISLGPWMWRSSASTASRPTSVSQLSSS